MNEASVFSRHNPSKKAELPYFRTTYSNLDLHGTGDVEAPHSPSGLD